MIKNSEIRIGNFLNCGIDEDDDGNEIPMPGRVLQIFENTIHWTNVLTQLSVADGYSSTNLGYIDPIPLTPEWLERCGFEWKRLIHRWKHPCGWLVVQTDFEFQNGFGDGTFIQPSLRYLHQLQNLYFALTGEELEIKLS